MQQPAVIAPLVLAMMLFAGVVVGQDGQAPGDAARKAKQQKDAQATQLQGKDAAPAKTPKLITNDDIPPASFQPVAKVSRSDQYHAEGLAKDERKIPAAQWKSEIQGQKSLIANLRSQIDQISESIRFAPARCVNNCVQRNQRQLEKQQQVETLKAQLDDQQKKLEDMQEQARKQGYGSSVYEP
jgi:hypothetical protein